MSRKVRSMTLLSSAIVTGAGQSVEAWSDKKTFQAIGTTSAGAGASSILIQVSNDRTNWLTLGTISLVLSTSVATDGFASDAPWRYVRANVSSISGTDAAVSVFMANEVG